MDVKRLKLGTVIILAAMSMNAAAVSYEIAQYSLFLSAPALSGSPYQDDQLGYYTDSFPQINSFEGSGFGVTFSNNMGSDNLGEVVWGITNNTGGTLAASQLTGYLDADLGVVDPDFGVFEYFDEFGAVDSGVDTIYDFWEIDDAHPSFGNIYSHLQDDSVNLDNTNSLPSDSDTGDVALALGFSINNWLAGETILIKFMISEAFAGQAGLAQFDTVTDDTLHFSGSIQNLGVVPIPGAAGLMLSGLIFLGLARYRNSRIRIT